MALPLLLGAGLIAQLFTEGQGRKQHRADQAAARQQMGQQAADAITGAGFQMGPRVGADPMQQQQLGAIARNMASPMGDVRQQAFGQLNSLSPSSQTQLARDRVALNREQLELQMMQNPQAATDPTMLANMANQLRDERRADLGPYEQRLQSYDELAAAVQSQSGPASMAALFKFISALDDSVVRDSEGRLLTTSSGPIRTLVDGFNQLQGGGMFGPETINEIMQVAGDIARTQFEAANEINKRHDILAGQYAQTFLMPQLPGLTRDASFDPDRVFSRPAQQQAQDNAVTVPDPDRYEVID